MEKKLKEFMSILKGMSGVEYFEKYMLFLLAPVVSGFKPSSTITLKKDSKEYFIWNNHKEVFLNKINLDYKILREDDRAVIVLIYSSKRLSKFVENIDVRSFLYKLGYNMDWQIEEFLNKLVERYNIYHCPHELGIFLGIPLKDVIDFMECSNKKCLLCGYWKVYNNFENATSTFKKYDESKETMLNYLIAEYETEKIISMF
ncbi:DUF3793 family protein [Clostridium sp.]|uniref:DUF3793 family protein n=1 Tax=Clostridium sp. TaxID=1506 RepID=UPI002FC892F3